jgi:transcriptional regulator with XRE-family HTH domain
MAEKLNMSTTGYAKIERGETQLKIPRLEKIAAALEMELEDILRFNEKTVFKGPFHDESCQNNYVNPAKEMLRELETSRLLIEQQKREIELLKEQVSQLKQIIELMRKPA